MGFYKAHILNLLVFVKHTLKSPTIAIYFDLFYPSLLNECLSLAGCVYVYVHLQTVTMLLTLKYSNACPNSPLVYSACLYFYPLKHVFYSENTI